MALTKLQAKQAKPATRMTRKGSYCSRCKFGEKDFHLAHRAGERYFSLRLPVAVWLPGETLKIEKITDQ